MRLILNLYIYQLVQIKGLKKEQTIYIENLNTRPRLLLNMGLSKKDLARKKRNLENRIAELEEKARKNPMDKKVKEELEELRKKLEKEKQINL